MFGPIGRRAAGDRGTVAAGALLIAACLVSSAEAADYVVLGGAGTALRPGAVIADGEAVRVDAGGEVQIMARDGRIVSLRGPHDGPVPEAGAAGDGAVVATVSALLGGGSGGSVGAVRGVVVESAKGSRDPWLLPVAHSGDICLAPGEAPVRLGRDGRNVVPVAFVSRDRDWKMETVWPAWASAVELASDFAPRDGERLDVRVGDSTTEWVVHLPPAGLDTPGRVAAWAADAGCRDQALAVLRAETR